MKEAVVTLLDAVLITGAGGAVNPTQSVQSYQATLSNTTTPAATVVIEGSNDRSGWVALATLSPSGAADSAGATITAAWPYVRANVTAISGTSASVTVTASY
jgi:hypothetical protein